LVRDVSKAADLHFLVQQLDAIRAFRRVDLSRTQESFLRLGLRSPWNKVKRDLEAITYLPETLPGLPKLIGAATILRFLFPIAIIGLILSLFIRMGFFPSPPLPFFLVLFFAPLITMAAFITVDLTIRRRITAYEKQNPLLHSDEKRRIKKVIEDLMHRLNAEIDGEDRCKYEMSLYFDDYHGIEILNQKQQRIFGVFKRGYSKYTAIPSGKKK
jgi:hypothetical protein